jgi:hypothetical protein
MTSWHHAEMLALNVSFALMSSDVTRHRDIGPRKWRISADFTMSSDVTPTGCRGRVTTRRAPQWGMSATTNARQEERCPADARAGLGPWIMIGLAAFDLGLTALMNYYRRETAARLSASCR